MVNIPQISTKLAITSHLNLLNTEKNRLIGPQPTSLTQTKSIGNNLAPTT